MTLATTIGALLSTVSLGQCLLSASLLLIRKDPHRIYTPLIVFFVSFAVSALSVSVDIFRPTGWLENVFNTLEVSSYITLLLLLPSLWIYVRNISNEHDEPRHRMDFLHAIPFLIGVVVAVVLLFLPTKELTFLVREGKAPDDFSQHLVVSVWALYVLMCLWGSQSLIYIAFISRRLVNHQTKLKQIFSSTEHKELLWIYAVIFLITTAVMVTIVNMFFTVIDSINFVVDLCNVALIYVLSHWGLRQRSTITNEESETDTKQPGATENSKKIPLSHFSRQNENTEKYEKSALSNSHIDKIEQQILNAMEKERLYLDPNLSLADLAKVVSEPSSYVSQTLNGRIGESFFDFINRWRVIEAQRIITSTDKTIFDIAYEVGFNSRSSFYKSFKRETGMTPTAYRKKATSQ